MKPRVPKVAIEISRGRHQNIEWDGMFARNVVSVSIFKQEEQLRFTSKVNIMHVHRLKNGLNTLVKYIEDNDLNQYM